jgi:hypothetical protein
LSAFTIADKKTDFKFKLHSKLPSREPSAYGGAEQGGRGFLLNINCAALSSVSHGKRDK